MLLRAVALATGLVGVGACAEQVQSEPVAIHTSLEGEKIGEVFAQKGKILTRIGREFPAFDTDYSGELALYEYRKWLNPLIELRLRYDEATASPDEIETFISSGFEYADTDENGEVSQDELALYFGENL